MRTRTRLIALVAGLMAAAALGGVAVAASAASPSPRTHGHGDALCGTGAHVRTVVITREAINPETFSFPATVTVTGHRAVVIADELCGLSAPPPGVRFCPDEWGPTYTLTFSNGDRTIATVTANPTGCDVLSLAEGTATPLSKQATPQFWHVLGRAMGIAPATQQTFVGVSS
jgi:hypothetical protein